MNKLTKVMLAAVACGFLTSAQAGEFEPDTSDSLQLDVAKALINLKEADPSLQRFFDDSAGYAIFPSVGKGGIGIGGAHGKGLVIVDGEAVGNTKLSQVTIGLQLGGQKYAQIIFFKDEYALGNFKRGNYELGAQASAVAVNEGASSDADYDSGVAIFTQPLGGLMFEASVGGQKFTYEDL